LEKLETSPEQFAADTDPSTRVGGIFTDGSYKMSNLTRGSLLAPMDVLRRNGVSGAAVVYLGTPEHWEKAPARILRIVPTDTADEMDVFCSELTGITMGTRVAEGLPYHITLYSDCIAAIARSHTAFAPRLKAMGHLRNGQIYDILCQQSLVMNRLIKWIKSHPEKLKKIANFADEDWRSYFADAAAEGKWEIIRKHLPHAKIHTVYLEDIMDEIFTLGS
jgi:hypothetical protein